MEIQPKHRLGQNFLHEEEACERFAALVPLVKKLLEIGPGLGAITKLLAKRAKKLTAVELDAELEPYLQKTLTNFKIKNVEVKIGDALEENFSSFDVVAGALPFNIASAVIQKFMQSKCKTAVFIVQSEVARRLAAQPGSGEYSRISILAQNGARVEIIEILPPSFFWPQPKVNSAIIKIEKTGKKIKINDELVRVLFQHKNQNIRKALRHSGERWAKVAEEIPLQLATKRARELDLQELNTLSSIINVQ